MFNNVLKRSLVTLTPLSSFSSAVASVRLASAASTRDTYHCPLPFLNSLEPAQYDKELDRKIASCW